MDETRLAGEAPLVKALGDLLTTGTTQRELLLALLDDVLSGRLAGSRNKDTRDVVRDAVVGRMEIGTAPMAPRQVADLLDAALSAHALGRLGDGSTTMTLLERLAREAPGFQEIRAAASDLGTRLSTAFGGRP